MPVDLDALRKKHEQLNNMKAPQGDFENRFLQVQDGDNIVRLLPSSDDDKNFYAETKLHRIQTPDGNNRNVHCLKTHGKECPLCDAYHALWQKHNQLGLPRGEDSEFSKAAKQIKPRDRYYFNIVDRTDDNVKILSVGIILFKKIVAAILDEDYGDITDTATGHDFKIVRVQEGDWPKYDQSAPRPKSTPAGSDAKVAEYMDSLHDIHALVKEEDYDEVKAFAEQYNPTERPLKDSTGDGEISEEEFLDNLKS